MDAHAAMTAFYFDALRYVGRLLPTALPSAHTIGSAEYRSSWYGGRLGHRGSETRIYILRTLPAYVLIKLPRIGRPRIAGEWASERNGGESGEALPRQLLTKLALARSMQRVVGKRSLPSRFDDCIFRHGCRPSAQ